MAIAKRTVVLTKVGDALVPSEWAQVVDTKAGMLWEPFLWRSGNNASGSFVGVAAQLDDICKVNDTMIVEFAMRNDIMGVFDGQPLHGGFQTLRG